MCFGSKPKITKSQISAPRPMPLPRHTHPAPMTRRAPPPPPGHRNPPPQFSHPAHAAPARRLPPYPSPPPSRPLPPLPLKASANLKNAQKKVQVRNAAHYIPHAHSAAICHVDPHASQAAHFQIHAETVYAKRYDIPRKAVGSGGKVPVRGGEVRIRNRMSNMRVNDWEMF